jgi:putative ABC transport system substrate-binding protein
MPIVGVLAYGAPDPREFVATLRDALGKLGYVEGQNILLDIRSAEGKTDRLPGLAADLVREKVNVIVTFITPAMLAAKRATSEIPIVLAGAGAPVEAGLVASLARPGGNITGTSATTADLAQKNLQILQEILPSVRRVGMMLNESDPAFGKALLAQNQDAAAKLGIDLVPISAKSPATIDVAFATAARERVGAVVIQPSLGPRRASELGIANRLPLVSPGGDVARAGGLVSYTADRTDLWRKTAILVDKILKGAKPADLPIEEPTKFELVVNLKTANALGLTLPQSLLARADEVIE